MYTANVNLYLDATRTKVVAADTEGRAPIGAKFVLALQGETISEAAVKNYAIRKHVTKKSEAPDDDATLETDRANDTDTQEGEAVPEDEEKAITPDDIEDKSVKRKSTKRR